MTSPWTAAHQASLSFIISTYLLILMSIESIMPSNSSSVTPIFSCPQSFSAPMSFPMSWLFTWDSQSIGASTLALVLPMNIQGWFPLGLTGLMSLQSKELSRVFSSTIVQKHQFLSAQLVLWSNSHICTWKTMVLMIHTFVSKVISMLLNILSGSVISFLPRSKPCLISWLQSPSGVILEPRKIKFVIASIFPPYICHAVMRLDAIILSFLNVEF